jgi:hypothetical protein
MTFKLDPVARFDALQRAKEWQKQFPGNSPTNFSSGLVARSGPGRAVQDYDLSPQEIILPEDGVFSTAGGNISDSQFNAWQNESELARRALGLKGDMHRENMKEKWYSEYLAKGDEGGGWEDILSGALSGASAGASFGPWGALAGAGVGGITSAIG